MPLDGTVDAKITASERERERESGGIFVKRESINRINIYIFDGLPNKYEPEYRLECNRVAGFISSLTKQLFVCLRNK